MIHFTVDDHQKLIIIVAVCIPPETQKFGRKELNNNRPPRGIIPKDCFDMNYRQRTLNITRAQARRLR